MLEKNQSRPGQEGRNMELDPLSERKRDKSLGTICGRPDDGYERLRCEGDHSRIEN